MLPDAAEINPNEDLIRKVIAHIEEDPATRWNQSNWITYNCNTRFCFAGWAAVLSGFVDKNGAPTNEGLEFIREHDFFEPAPRSWDNEGKVERWTFPYDSVAEVVLGLGDGQNSMYHVNPIFGQYMAKPDGFDPDAPEYDWDSDKFPPDDIEIFKRRITELTGVTFESAAS